MYYEEKIINGVLCHRSTPDGEWVQFTSEQLSAMLIIRQEELKCYKKYYLTTISK